MKKEMVEFINGNRNVVQDEFIVGRERVGNSELVFVSLPQFEEPLYVLFNSKKTSKKYRKQELDGEITFERVESKSTGGKKSYIMLMPYAIEELNKQDISLEVLGALYKMIPCIEWNTGRILRIRDKKSMTVTMIAKYLGIGIKKTKSILKDLSSLDVISYDLNKRAYFINQRFMRKGGNSRED